ncbi:hypothetical protein ACIPSJ_48175 [Streptomyces sp. NPDC090088]|uniref:hypothetical protein n=1 Tax=Streptomyces sp. NPDC090088 TaxID=3365944 RepID=UPI0037FCFE07
MLVRDCLNTHVSCTVQALIDAQTRSPSTNCRRTFPRATRSRGVRSHLKRSPANLTEHHLDQFTAVVKTRLKRMRYRPVSLRVSRPGPDASSDRPVAPTIEDLQRSLTAEVAVVEPLPHPWLACTFFSRNSRHHCPYLWHGFMMDPVRVDGKGVAVTGLELVAAAAVAYLVRKAGRVGRRADEEVNHALDEGMDRLHELIQEKLGADPVLDRLTEQAETGAVTERTERRAALAVADAAEADGEFATRLRELVMVLQQQEEVGRGDSVSVSNLISGGTQSGPVFQGGSFGTINIGTTLPPAPDAEGTEGKGQAPAI